MKTLSHPAYGNNQNTMTLRGPEINSVEASERKIRKMLLSNSTFATYINTVYGVLIDYTFNLYCFADAYAATTFFTNMNGDYLRYRGDDHDDVIQLLDKTVIIDDVARNHWQFSITGLKYSYYNEGDGVKPPWVEGGLL